MSELTDRLDALHEPGANPATPRIGTDADRLTMAAFALMSALRVTPEWWYAERATLDAETGHVTIDAPLRSAESLAEALGLPRLYSTVLELDGGALVTRWSGLWSDWPITVRYVQDAAAPAATHGGGL